MLLYREQTQSESINSKNFKNECSS